MARIYTQRLQNTDAIYYEWLQDQRPVNPVKSSVNCPNNRQSRRLLRTESFVPATQQAAECSVTREQLGMSFLCKYATAAYFTYCHIFQQSALIAYFFA